MAEPKKYLYSFLQFVIFFLSLATNWYSGLVVILFVICVIMTLDRLGKSIVLREIIALHTCFICLIAPLAGYKIFDDNNALVRLWVKQMPVNENIYFGFSLPAVAGFIIMLCWPINNKNCSDGTDFIQSIINKAKVLLATRPKTGLYLLIVGVTMFWVSNFLPTEIQFAFLLFYFASFSGFLYVFYTSNFRYKYLMLTLFSGFILLNAFSSGMFTVVAYMGLTLFSFFFLGKRTRLWKKVSWFLVGILLLTVLQLVKPAYRRITWQEHYTGNRAMLFIDLTVDKVSEFNWRSADAFFPVYVRTNQGFNVALVMRRMPTAQPFDNGNRLMLSAMSSLVPRVLWSDKPEAGGKFNMKYYAGYVITGWSTNIGPLGEAYGSFGVEGGIIYMIFLGIFIRWAYARVFVIARKIPLIIFWIPVLFYQTTYSAESDTLQILNSMVKSAFFIFLIYKLVPTIFILPPKSSYNRNRNISSGPFLSQPIKPMF